MNQLYDLYLIWYEKYSSRYIKEPNDELRLEFNHLGGGQITYMHYDYDYAPEDIITWRRLHHGIYLLQQCIEDGMGPWISVKFSNRITHGYSIPQAYNSVVNMLEKQLDEGKQLQQFLALPITKSKIKEYFERDFKVTCLGEG